MELWNIIRFILVKFLEPIYFSIFLIIGKDLKQRKILFILIMLFEYLMLTSIIKFNIWFQLIYTFLSFINLKVLYKEKAQITDIFLFTAASIILIIVSIFSFTIIQCTINIYNVALILNRIILFLILFIFKNKIREWYKEFYSLWNRHHKPNKIKSLTIRNISIISFNTMFWIINIGMVLAKLMLQGGA